MLSSRGWKRRAPSHTAGADDGLAISRHRVAASPVASSVTIAPSARPAVATRRASSVASSTRRRSTAAASAGRASSAAVTSTRHASTSASSTHRTSSNASSTGRVSSAAVSPRPPAQPAVVPLRWPTPRLASSSASASPDVASSADALLQQQMEVMRHQMQSMHDIVITLSANVVQPSADVPAPLAASTDDAPVYALPPAAEFASAVDTGEHAHPRNVRAIWCAGRQQIKSQNLGRSVC